MYPILKSRGVWFNGQLALNRDQLAELGYGPETNPFHINPETGERFDESLYTLKNPQTALMEEIAKNFMKAGKTRDWGQAKMMAKSLMNRATDKNNMRKLEKYGGAAAGQLLKKRWREDGSLEHEYDETYYSEKWQKHPRPDKVTGEFNMEGKGAPKVHPADRVVRDKKGKLTTFSLSSRPDPHLGEFIEGAEVHDEPDLIQGCRDVGVNYPYEHTIGGVGHPRLMVPGAWIKDHKTQNPTGVWAGTGKPQEGEHLHTGPTGDGFDLISAVLSLDPRYWLPRGYKNLERKMPILNDLFQGRIPEDLLRKIANCPVGEFLVAEHDRPEGYPASWYKPAKDMDSPFRQIINDIMHNPPDDAKPGIGIPTMQQGGAEEGSDAWKARTAFDYNAGHMLMHMGSRGGAVTHTQGALRMAEAVLGSLMLQRQKRVRRSPLQSEFRGYFPGYTPLQMDKDVKPIDFHEGMRGIKIPEEAAPEPSERTGFAEFGPAGGVTPGEEVTIHGPRGRPLEAETQPYDPTSFRMSMDAVIDRIYSDIIKTEGV